MKARTIYEADQESIDIVTAFLLERLSMLSWLRVERSKEVVHNNQINIKYKRSWTQVVPKEVWFNGGSIAPHWDDPMRISYLGSMGQVRFSAYDPDVLDKIVQFLEKKFKE